MKEPNAKKNACWVFETVRIISIIISLICFTEKVYGSSPYSPINFPFFYSWIVFISSLVLVSGLHAYRDPLSIKMKIKEPFFSIHLRG